MFVNRVLVVLVKLQQTPRVLELRDQFFQHVHLVQAIQQIGQAGRVGQQRHESLRSRFGNRDRLHAHRLTDRQPGLVPD